MANTEWWEPFVDHLHDYFVGENGDEERSTKLAEEFLETHAEAMLKKGIKARVANMNEDDRNVVLALLQIKD